MTAPPRVLTEKITTEPKVISESLELPIRQKIITQPTVLNKTIKAQPQFIYGQNEVIERQPVFLPAQQTYQKVEKNVTVPGNTVEYYTYVQPKEHTIYQKINVNEANVRKQELQPIFKGVQTENNVIPKPVQVPGATIYQQNVLQPVIDRERTRLEIKDGQESYYEKSPQVLPTQFSESTKVQEEFVPGSTIYKQYTVQPKLTAEHLEVNYQNSQPIFRTAPVKYNTPITNVNSQTKTYDRSF